MQFRHYLHKAPLAWLSLVTVLVLGSSPILAQSSVLQPSQDPLQDFNAEDPNDISNIFTDRAGSGSLLNLINRLQTINSRTPGEFAEDQTENFNSAVEAFRNKQQQKLQNETFTAPESLPAPLE